MGEPDLSSTVRDILQAGRRTLAANVWDGEKGNRAAAHKLPYDRAACNGRASTANHTPEMEKTALSPE